MASGSRIIDVVELAGTLRVGEQLGRHVTRGTVIDLRGTLGAGKTALVRGLARGLGIASGVASPTFIICREYQGRLRL